MSLAIVYTRAQCGIDAPLVTVEIHLSNGLPSLSIVGLPETAVKESKDRVRSAIINSHFEFPARRITVNLAPADLPKEGGRFDLAIALGILAASGQVPSDALADMEFLGELALSGELRHVRAALPASMACGANGRSLVVPESNGREAALCRHTTVYAARSLLQLCAHLHGREPLPTASRQIPKDSQRGADLADVKGQARARRALEIAAAGGHNILFYGPPGTGKTMLASRLAGILPPLEESEALEVAALASIAKGEVSGAWFQRPFRAPHHTASAAAMVGGGSNPTPGEVSLAHRGVLFLDELPEFPRQVLEVLREPLESGNIAISRVKAQVNYPARFQLVAAMNPCPCGYFGSGDGRCHCTAEQVQRYRRKISGPLLDRFDLQVPVNAVNPQQLQSHTVGESSERVQARVLNCRSQQQQRQGKSNALLAAGELDNLCRLDDEQQALLEQAMDQLGLSARAYHRTLRVARTLADMEGKDKLEVNHLTEALSYRNLDRRTITSVA